ncbi:MAG: STAS domain-containing protein [Desulfotalea sp.]
MKVETIKEGDISVISLLGRLNSTTAGSLEEQLRPYIDAPNSHLVLNLAELDYMSSAGLRIMLLLSKKYKSNEWNLAIANMQVHVLEVFEMSGFDAFVDIEADIDSAKTKVNN